MKVKVTVNIKTNGDYCSEECVFLSHLNQSCKLFCKRLITERNKDTGLRQKKRIKNCLETENDS
jgi:hypothetical protein